MNVPRKIAEGVASWLMYEFHSYRGQLFSEKYLSAPIGNILSGIYRNRVLAEYNHPILNQHTLGAGRPHQIDFVVKTDSNIDIAVESKWVSSSQVKVEDIIWDLIRLELLNYNFNTKCYFVLGGQKRSLQKLFENPRFQEERPSGGSRPVLRIKKERKQSIRIDNPPMLRIEGIRNKLLKFPNVFIPGSISTGYPEFYPKDCKNIEFQVYVWEITSYKNKPRFYPGNHDYYK